MRKLFELCPLCKGARVRVMGGRCLGCNAEGYIEIGLTMGQVERMAEAERRRQGDPPAVARAIAEERHRLRNFYSPAFVVVETLKLHVQAGLVRPDSLAGMKTALASYDAMMIEEKRSHADPAGKTREVSLG